MNGVGAGAQGDLHEAGDVEVGGGQVERLVREADVAGFPVGVGVNGHRGDAEFLAGADHPEGDLSTVGDEHFRKHVWISYSQGCVVAAGAPCP
ncbi:hypothetical protein D3C87_1857360 [compost metagenome]